MKNEDFGYMIETEGYKTSILSKKPIKIAIVLTSILLFVIITISAYYFSRNGEGNEIKLIKSPSLEIKVRNKDANLKVKNIDKTIYDNIVGVGRDKKNMDNIKIIKSSKTAKPNQKIRKNSLSILNLPLPNQGSDKEKINVILATKQENIKKPYGRVQLASFKSKESAYRYWKGLKKDFPKLFFDQKYFIQKIELGKRGVFYRLQVGYFANQLKAEGFCIKFIDITKKRKSDCIMVE